METSEEFERRLRLFLFESFGLKPETINPFLCAFTHSSFKAKKEKIDYEKLELLGDSCIGLIVTSYLYSLNISLKEMCNLRKEIVQSSSLSFISEKIGLKNYIRVGKSCKEVTKSMLEDVYESFIGSIYVMFGFQKAKEIVEKTLLNSYKKKELIFVVDYKSKLQELVQKKIKKDILYTLENVVPLGEGRQKFFVSLFIGGELKGKGEANRLKDAEQMAAKQAYLDIGR